MSRSLSVREDCTEQLKLAIRQNGYHSQRAFAETAGYSLATVSKFLKGRPVDFSTFVELSNLLSLDWQNIADIETQDTTPPASEIQQFSRPSRQDWGDPVDISQFQGRVNEIKTLTQWIDVDRCRFVAILGFGGIGKTTLAAKIAHSLQDQFDGVIWRCLLSAPPFAELISEVIKFISQQSDIEVAQRVDAQISQLLQYFRQHRYLLVLDNVESILEAGDRRGRFRSSYEDYGQLFTRIGASLHKSCLLITSREPPKGLAAKRGLSLPVRSLTLGGVPAQIGKKLLSGHATFTGSEEHWQMLSERYCGNPLALKMVAALIRDVFDSSLAQFISFAGSTSYVFDDIQDLLDQQYHRLSTHEKEMMYWFAVSREPLTFDDLSSGLHQSPGDLVQDLAALQGRVLIEKTGSRYALQPVVMEYLTARLIQEICNQIGSWQSSDPLDRLSLLRQHPLIQVQAKDYVQAIQLRLILRPIIDQLILSFGDRTHLERHLKTILTAMRGIPPQSIGYGAGNIINLLRYMGMDLSRQDLSKLCIRQANLKGINLQRTSFAACDLKGSAFSEPFSSLYAVACSVDGELIAAGDSNGDIHLWRLYDGQRIASLQGHTNWIWSIAFSPNGRYLASGSFDTTVKLWDLDDGSCINTLPDHGKAVRSVAFSPDGTQLASGSDDGNIRLWDVQSGDRQKIFSGHQNWVWTLAFSPCGEILASGSEDGTLKLWNIASGDCLSTMSEHNKEVWSVAFSPDGDVVASGSADRTIKLWEMESGCCLNTFSGHTDGIWAIAFDPHGQFIASGSADSTLKIWSLQDRQCQTTLQGHTSVVWSIAFASNSRGDLPILVSGSADRTLKLWNVRPGRCIKTIAGYTNPVRAVSPQASSSNPSLIVASGGNDDVVRLWNLDTGKCIKSYTAPMKGIFSLAFSPNGQLLAAGCNDKTVRIWNLEEGNQITLRGHTHQVRSVAFSPNGRLLISGSFDRTLKLWDMEERQCLRTFSGHTHQVRAVAFNPEGNHIASASVDRTVKLWNIHQKDCLKTLAGHTAGVSTVAFNPQGTILASGAADRTVRLWKIPDGELIRTLKGHSHPVWSVSFSPHGKHLASGSFDQSVKLWDVTSGECLQTLQGHTNGIWSVAFVAQGDRIISGGEDESIKVWDLESGQCLVSLKIDRLYEGMDITGVTGLSNSQKVMLQLLGAIEH